MKIRSYVSFAWWFYRLEFLLVVFLFTSFLFTADMPEASAVDSAETADNAPGEAAEPLPSTEVYFSPETDILHLLRQRINLTNNSLYAAISSIDSGELVQALAEARDRGVRVHLILDEGYAQENPTLAKFLISKGMEVRFLSGEAGGRMNNNFAIFDNRELLTGSYNWTERSQRFNLESVLFTNEPEVVTAYMQEFERLKVLSSEASKKAFAKPLLPKLPQEETEGAKVPQPKELLGISFPDLEIVFGKESPLSDSEKKRAWEDYQGKYVQWQGVVVYRGVGRMDWNRVGIRHSQGKGVDVEVSFKWNNMHEVLALREGDTVTYTARLSKRKGYGSPYRLDDGELIKQD